MLRVDLKPVSHDYKTGMESPDIEPNVPSGDLMFYDGGELIGFYLEQIPEQELKLLEFINRGFRSKRVPKTLMERSDIMSIQRRERLTRKEAILRGTPQYSTILGGIPKKPHMMRNYCSVSSVHREESAQKFIKAMLSLANHSALLLKHYMPNAYDSQLKMVHEETPEAFRFGSLFTITISNYNVAAKLHVDRQNLVGSYNFIYTSRQGALGGNLFLPDYGVVLNSKNNSLIVYPAWRNMHGVTPIHMRTKHDYRNTHIFYALRGFKG